MAGWLRRLGERDLPTPAYHLAIMTRLGGKPARARRHLIAALTLVLVAAGSVAVGPAVEAAPTSPSLVAAGSSTSSATSYSLGTRSFSSGHLYVAFLSLVETGDHVDATPGVVGSGTTWTAIDKGEASASTVGMTAYSFRPSSDVSGVALGTAGLSTGHEGIWYAIVDVSSGFAASAPIAQYKADRSGSGTSFSVSLPSSPKPDSLVLAAFSHNTSSSSTPSSGLTELDGTDVTSSAVSGHVVFDGSSPAATAGSSWSGSASRRRGLAIEIQSTTDGGGGGGGLTIAAAGDICGDTHCADTANRVLDFDPDWVITVGDLAYDNGLYSEYLSRYGGGTNPATRWGRPAIKDITLPGYGNHDCVDFGSKNGCDDAVRYFGSDSKFGTDISGTPGSYWTVKGDWLIVQLNSAGDAGSGKATSSEISAQKAALESILNNDNHTCEMLVWHHPRYNSGSEGGNATFIDPWFDTAYANGVDVILNGHAHDYERFGQQDGNGNARSDGVREFVVGTGGKSVISFNSPKPNSQVRISDFGILTMHLDSGSYSWAFLDDTSGATDDSGSTECHS
jgi:hypothetical protein